MIAIDVGLNRSLAGPYWKCTFREFDYNLSACILPNQCNIYHTFKILHSQITIALCNM